MHDLGTRLGCYGYGSVNSPNLDSLAASGVRFTRSFATAPFCSPSRGAMYTGKYTHVNGLMGNVNLGWELPASNTTIARALGKAGYETFLLGYQHEAREERIPDLGFGSADMAGGRSRKVAPRVAAFLRERAGSPAPFFLQTGFFEVHRPFDKGYEPEDPAKVSVPEWLADTPGAREDLSHYDGCVRDMDAGVGMILEALEESGLAGNTMVIFTTDHGSPFPRAKGTLYDAGINTSLLVRWPAGFGGGRVLDEMIGNVDLFPTVLEAAGAEIPDDIQGRSFLPLLQGREYAERTEVFAEANVHETDPKRAIRTARHKLIHNLLPGPSILLADSEGSLTRRDYGNDHLRPRPEFELYDLVADPTERNNLAGREEHAAVQRELAGRLRQISEETGDPALKGPVPRPPGERETLDGAVSKVEERSAYSREGLRNAHFESYRDDWEFAPLPESRN
jgi:arylsulfatase A-like enzyme